MRGLRERAGHSRPMNIPIGMPKASPRPMLSISRPRITPISGPKAMPIARWLSEDPLLLMPGA